MAEDQSQTIKPAGTSEGIPTGGQPHVTAAGAEARADDATIHSPATPPDTPPTGPAAGDGAAALDVGQRVPMRPQDYLKQVESILQGGEIPPELAAPASPSQDTTPVVTAPEVEIPEADEGDTPPAPGKRPAMKVPLPADQALADLQSETLRVIRERNKRNIPITPTEAEAIARKTLGLPAEDAAPTAAAPQSGDSPTPANPAEPEGIDAIQAQIAELLGQKRENHKNFNFDEDTDLDEKIEVLRDRKSLLQIQQNQSWQQQAQAWDQSRASVAAAFGADYADPNSALNIIARAVEAEWQASADPRLSALDAPAQLYAEAAKKLGRPATAPQATPQSPTSKAVTRPPAAAALLASGNAGSAASPPPEPGAAMLPNFRNPSEYLAFAAQVGGGTAMYAQPKTVRR